MSEELTRIYDGLIPEMAYIDKLSAPDKLKLKKALETAKSHDDKINVLLKKLDEIFKDL